VIADETGLAPLRDALAGTGIAVAAGAEALVEAARRRADLMVAAIVGAAGLPPTLAALEAGTSVALANKEALVCAGALMTVTARRTGAALLPVDSEHNAIFQVLEARERVRRITLTASGGPFRTLTLEAMAAVTPAQAVKHPTWSMGAKISVDSATLMNKGLELIEAYHLFGVRPDQLGVLVHPQSLVHGLVEYVDGSVLAQLGPADMRVPIAHALAWPERIETPVERLCLATAGRLEFEEADRVRFPALALAEAALAAGGCRPCALNAANEVAVAAFLAGRIGFLDIADVVAAVLDCLAPACPETLEAVFAIDRAARAAAEQAVAASATRSFAAQAARG
jgi:1-deoxy-D-xylulose-5-phosphate reductoisomerase